jgi:DNA polymerase III psi subunit
MKEAIRQFYLSALGIDVWEARHSLRGAASSVAQSIDSTSGTPGPAPVTEEKAVFEPDRIQGLDEIKSVLEEESGSGVAGEEPEIASLPVEAKEEQADSTLSLQAAFWHGSRLSLAADLGANPGREIQLRLGANIMHALGEPGVSPEVMQWPAFENRALPGNDDAAFERLVKGITVSGVSFSWLILGPESIEILSPRFRNLGHGVRLSSELTLSHLVSDGTAKRDLWELIKQSNLHRPLGHGNGE